MTRKRTKVGVALLVAFALSVGGLASPAHAAVSKNGTRYCSTPTPAPKTYLTASGSIEARGPGGPMGLYFHSTLVSHYQNGTAPGGAWQVKVTGGLLSDPGTYGVCVNWF